MKTQEVETWGNEIDSLKEILVNRKHILSNGYKLIPFLILAWLNYFLVYYKIWNQTQVLTFMIFLQFLAIIFVYLNWCFLPELKCVRRQNLIIKRLRNESGNSLESIKLKKLSTLSIHSLELLILELETLSDKTQNSEQKS